MSSATPTQDTVKDDGLTASQSRVKRLSNVVEKTVDNLLSRSTSATSSVSGTGSSSSSPRRVFSLNRKNRNSNLSPDREATPTVSSSTPALAKQKAKTSIASPSDDSPFIRPPSPPLRPSLLRSFRGDGSMRAGTQTLIQALQALPWMNGSDNEDDSSHEAESGESDEEEERPAMKRLASSIHTIHRPLARSQRIPIPTASKAVHGSVPTETDREDLADILSEEEEIENDFEEESRDIVLASQVETSKTAVKVPSRPSLDPHERAGSMATIRLHRRARLADKLREVFELDEIREVLAEMPCWLLRSVLLQGYMYLTNSYLCFFAHMPSREDQVLKSGSLNKKAQRTKRWIKHWFVLKNDALSWYQSSADPYFPHGIVDLRYALSCEPYGEKGFRLRTNAKTITLSADSVPSREEWVKAIRKVIFKAQNMGDSVKIAIPYSAILDVERSSAMDFSETIEVKIVEKDNQFTVDSYFFAYFHDLADALDQIRDAVRKYHSEYAIPGDASPPALLDTTAPRSPIQQATTIGEPSSPRSSVSAFRLSSLFRPFSEIPVPPRASSYESNNEEFTHVQRRGDSSFVPLTASPKPMTPINLPRHTTDPTPMASTSASSSSGPTQPSEHTYPPSTSNSAILYPNPPLFNRDSNMTNSSNPSSSWGLSMGVPSWLKAPRRAFVGSMLSTGSDAQGGLQSGGLGSSASMPVKEMYSSVQTTSPLPTSRSSGFGDLAFSVLESPDMLPDQDVADKFRAAFAYDEKEILLGYFPGYIYRLLPVFGKLYISTNYFCFKSSGPLAARTRMTLPIRDILATEKSRATRFGHYGLIIIIKGHEELFFEFSAEDKRDAFVSLLERQMDDVRRRLAIGEPVSASNGDKDALILEEFEARTSNSSDSDPAPPTDAMADDLPAVMFTSASSTFLTFKPKKSLHFTFLTIGSRGDVQPYISLAKGLMADGHRCRIATHGEFKEWIESYGIEFGFVGGDPAELMRICIENGTFTVSFLKEGLLKWRNWLDDLLKTSWEACQGTDVLMESPSAMAGYHIAEALGIPYFRAFTMTWTRTRAYPHAFAVPERKMGGSYNYMSYVMFDQVFWRATAGQINRWRRNLLRLPPTSLDKMEPHKIPFLYNFSPQVVPPPLDWPEWIRVTGYWFLDDAEVSAQKWTPPDSLVTFLNKARNTGKKVVYIGFGSIVVPDPKAMTHCVIEAVAKSGVYAILSKGWSDRLHSKNIEASDPEEPLPEQIYPIPSIPHDWLFRRIDAACHHGGAGTTGASLKAGIPTIIHPFFGDQYFWADRVEALGVGTGVRKLSVPALTDALVAATTDPKQISRAKTLGERMKGEDGVATAIESIYRDMEYARSLIKQRVALDLEDQVSAGESSIARQPSETPMSPSSVSSTNSVRPPPSEDWSVIDQDERRSSVSSGDGRKRASLSTAVLSVIPDSFVPGTSPARV